VKNLAPSTLASLPPAAAIELHSLADLEAAFNARRLALREQADAQLLAGRVLIGTIPQPSMASPTGPRTQPRDGRGRFLNRAWLAAAESYSPAELAWFRAPIAEGK
jgi:hypothetical protein